MFTGIIELCAPVKKISHSKSGLRLVLLAPTVARECGIGASIAINGACLTVAKKSSTTIEFDVIRETLRRTNLGKVRVGEKLNLERALRWNDRLEGHFVLGHVDATTNVKKVEKSKGGADLLIACPATIKKYVFEKGSVVVNGVSLTVGKVTNAGFRVHLIPLTLRWTNLSTLRCGDVVNIEADALIKAWLGSVDFRARSY